AYHAGAPLALTLSADGRHIAAHRLGPAVANGERPQVVVPAGCWQTARSLGEWTLVSCIVAPAFQYGSFEMAPPGWQPGCARAVGTGDIRWRMLPSSRCAATRRTRSATATPITRSCFRSRACWRWRWAARAGKSPAARPP